MTEARNDNGNISLSLSSLKERDKEPRSVRVLSSWISHASNQLDLSETGRLAWIIATTVTSAKLQQVVDAQGKARFSIKGGTLLQYRLGLSSRATRDLDGIVRGNIEEFINKLDGVLEEPWGPIEFFRSDVEEIKVSTRMVNPRKFYIALIIRGTTWRNVKVEISPDEGLAGSSQEEITPPPLTPFGLPTPERLVGMSMSYQIAQKIHAASMPHNPPAYNNTRARDVADLLLIKRMSESTGAPSREEISKAIRDVFSARANEAVQLGKEPRRWPIKLTAYNHWSNEHAAIAESLGLPTSLDDAIAELNDWIEEL